MKSKMTFNILLLFIISCKIYADVFPVDFIPITKNVILHKSYEIVSGYKFPSNGLIIISKKSVVIVDTAWNDEETQQIFNYIKKMINKPIVACIVTHFHQDRAGGIKNIVDNEIPIYMTEHTNKLLPSASKYFPYIKIASGPFSIDDIELEIEYLGPAHSPDNITIYYANERIFFGGCLIKSIDSNNLGNLEDADIISWEKVIKRLMEKYDNANIVIPGHGDIGNQNLLKHTLSLLEEFD